MAFLTEALQHSYPRYLYGKKRLRLKKIWKIFFPFGFFRIILIFFFWKFLDTKNGYNFCLFFIALYRSITRFRSSSSSFSFWFLTLCSGSLSLSSKDAVFLEGTKLLYKIWPSKWFFYTTIFISFESLGM